MPQHENDIGSSQAQSETASHDARQAPAHDGVWAELERAQQLASQVSGWGGNMADLARLELQLAVQSLPRILGLALALLPIAGLTWISLSILLAWFAYAASGIVAVGLLALFALQLGLLLLCTWRLKKLREKSSFPETRQQWQLFLEELKGSSERPAAPNRQQESNP